MADFCVGGSLGFPSFDVLLPQIHGLFTLPSLTFPPPPYDLPNLHLQVGLPSFSIPQLPNLLTWSYTPNFSMPLFDLTSWLNELISNFTVNLISLILDPIIALLGQFPWPTMPCPSGYDIFDIIGGSFADIANGVGSCLPSLAFIDGILDSAKNALVKAQAVIIDLIAKTANFIPSLLSDLLDYFDSLEIPGLPSLPSWPEIPDINLIIGSLPTLDLDGLRLYLSSFSFPVPLIPAFDFSTLIPDPLIESPLGPLALIEGIKAFIAKMSNLVLESIVKFWDELSDIVGGLIPKIVLPELCFPIPFGPPGPPF